MNLRNNLKGRMGFKSFIPVPIEEYEYHVDEGALQNLASAFRDLSLHLQTLPEDDRMQLVRMEANDSWRLADDKKASPVMFVSSVDNGNVENIVKATVYASEALHELPLSTRLIRNIHYLICAGSDYDRKYRGEYRKSPVWIGKPDSGLADAGFVPPVHEDMTSAIADLENYINYSEDNVFVKASIFHYYFEMIHPFIDGNGRTGRLLNTLFLFENGILPVPVLLLSHIISGDYNHYCEEIQHVHETGDISVWIRYWLNTMMESAEYTLRVLRNF